MPKIVVSTTSFAEFDKSPLTLCERSGYAVFLNPYRRKVKAEELVELAKDAVGLVAGTEELGGQVLSKLPQLKVISRCGAGLESVDIEAAKKLNIKVFNTPDAPTRSVAELTIALTLNLLRKVNQMDLAIRSGSWDKMMGNLLYGKKAAIIGFGRIGKAVAHLLEQLGCEVAFYDPFIEKDAGHFKRMEKDDLLSWADIVSLHAATKETILGDRELRMLKKGAWVINISRGEAIDENALYESLKSGHLSGAALDVFRQEPYGGPLKELKNVILTPHIGSYAKEARIKMEMDAVENLLKGLKEGSYD
jgi:D-3-phosphoglycerate dehydrogenase / 2-oxoglutarate reductase